MASSAGSLGVGRALGVASRSSSSPPETACFFLCESFLAGVEEAIENREVDVGASGRSVVRPRTTVCWATWGGNGNSSESHRCGPADEQLSSSAIGGESADGTAVMTSSARNTAERPSQSNEGTQMYWSEKGPLTLLLSLLRRPDHLLLALDVLNPDASLAIIRPSFLLAQIQAGRPRLNLLTPELTGRLAHR